MAFRCPYCGRALYLPISMGGAMGPCPSCQREIEGPRLIVDPDAAEVAGGGAASMPTAVERVGMTGGVGGEEAPVLDARVRDERSRFQARHRIVPSADGDGDDSWRKKHHDIQEEFRKRKKREEFAAKLATKKVAFLLLLVFSVVMGFVLYRNYEVRVDAGAREDGSVPAMVESAFTPGG